MGEQRVFEETLHWKGVLFFFFRILLTLFGDCLHRLSPGQINQKLVA